MLAAFGALGSFVIPMVIDRSFEPFLVAMAGPIIIGLLVMLQWPRVGPIWLGVVSLGLVLFSAPFLAEALTHPQSGADFIPLTVFAVSTLVGTVAAIPSFRQGSGPAAPSVLARTIAIGAGALIVTAALVSIVSAAGVESVQAEAGDIRVVTEDFRFRPAAFYADSGTISVHVTNSDDTRHTFTIDELGVDISVPPHTTQRVSFTAQPGTYEFYCRPHAPGMAGELVVR